MLDEMDPQSSALDEIMKMLKEHQAKRLGGLKEVSLEAAPKDGAAGAPDGDGDEDSESDADKLLEAVGAGKESGDADGQGVGDEGDDHSPENDGTGKPEDKPDEPSLLHNLAMKKLDQLLRPKRG